MGSQFNRRGFLAGSAAITATAAFGSPVFAQTPPTLPKAPTPEQWARSAAMQMVCLSPDGSHIAYLSEAEGIKYLLDFDRSTKNLQKFNLGPAKVTSLSWIDNTHILVNTIATSKIEIFAGGRMTFTLATIYNLQTHTTNKLFAYAPAFQNFITGEVNFINYKGENQVTAASIKTDWSQDQFKHLYRFPLDGSKSWELDQAPWETQNWVLTPEGELLGRSLYYDKSRVWSLDYYVNGSWKEIYRKKIDTSWPSLSGLGRDGKSLVVYVPIDDEGGNYFEISPEGALSEPLIDNAYRHTPVFDQYSFRLVGFSHYDGWTHYDYSEPKLKALYEKAKKATDGYRMALIDYARDYNQCIVYSEGDDDAGSYYFIDFATGQTVDIGTCYPDIAPEWISAKKAITYKAADGLEIEAYLSLPPNKEAKNLPLIMLPHGGPQSRDGIALDWQTETFTSQGYAVLQPNFRGSSGYGNTFVTAGHGQWGRKMQTDLSDGVRELVKQGLVDPKRVCIVGASYGGYAALAGATLDTGIYRCAVDIAGISDIDAFITTIYHEDGDREGTGTRYIKRFLGSGNLDEISPIKHIDKITIPVMIIHGTDDTVVEFDQSDRMAKAMKMAGKDVTFVRFKGQNHWETDEASRIEMMTNIMAFLKQHNPPG